MTTTAVRFSLLIILLVSMFASNSAQDEQNGMRDDSRPPERLTEVTLQQAIAMIEKRKLRECVARAICELTCNPDSYGSSGKRMYDMVRHFEADHSKQLDYYKAAAKLGRSCPTGESGCLGLYSNCKTPTTSLLRLASAIKIKS